MGVISYKRRKRMPNSAFAIPTKRKYPIPDKAHARNALARVAAYGTPAEKAQVKKAVYKKFPSLKKTKKGKKK